MARRVIKYGGGGVVVFTILWMVVAGGIKAYLAAHPPKVPPTVRYGVLPKIVFPEKKKESKTFVSEMANDELPKFADQAKVYVIYRPISRFLALEEDTKAAKEMGFTAQPIETSQNSGIYEFKNEVLNQTLVMNVPEGSFKLSYPYTQDQMLQNPEKVPSKEEAVMAAEGFLEGANKLLADLKNGEKKITYWKIEYDGLKQVTSQAEANVARVDFFRQPLGENLKIMPADVNRAAVSVVVSGATVEGKKIIEVTYKYAKIDRESFETYPIKSSQEAWKDLEAGNYWPATDTAAKEVTIRKMTMAYFEPVTLTNYLQPIFVFEGDGGFMAFVPAIVEKYLK